MTKEIKTIKQAEREIKRLKKVIDDSQNKIVDLAGYIEYEESWKKNGHS